MLACAKTLCPSLVTVIGALLVFAPTNAAGIIGPACGPIAGSDEPLLITPDCVDALYSHPVIDSQRNETVPVPHYHVSGHFDNTSIRFNFYFPPKDQWEGRFFQLAYPTQSENATAEHIAFGVDSNAYTVQVTGTAGYRAEAAGAKFSRVVAQQYYSSAGDRIYGYLYGGSGGSLQTVGGIENTEGVWDGAVPMVQAVPVSAPNGPSARAFFGAVLRPKMSEIQKALRPGGSGDPYAALNGVEQSVLREATRFGIPLRAWEDFGYVANRSTLFIQEPMLQSFDPTYATDFWTKPGYLGTDPGEIGGSLRDALVEFNTTIRNIERNSDNVPIAIELDMSNSTASMPQQVDTYGFGLAVYSANRSTELGKLRAFLNATTGIATLHGIGITNDPELMESLREGTAIGVTNRLFVALHAFYRHQVPSRTGFLGFDQYRGANGLAIYPQRPIDVSSSLSRSVSGGGTHSGGVRGKVIVIQNLMDSDAFPWHAHWYRTQVQRSLGEDFENNYRIYYNDNTEHGYERPTVDRLGLVVEYNGIFEQALRDISAWVEKGIAAPRATNYSITSENAVRLPETAAERAGIQPVVGLRVGNGGYSTSVGDAATYTSHTARVGEEVSFNAFVEAPPGTGQIVNTEWDFFGVGNYTSSFDTEPKESLVVSNVFKYLAPGNYTPILRVTSHRQGKVDATFGRVMNMARMHVEVR